MASARLNMSGVRKAFGPTRALRGVNLEVLPGEIHALIGENGAGKSTLMKILSGACRADEGSIELDGDSFQPGNPLHARRCGVVMIYQELMLAPHLTVQENILLGIEPSHWGWINARRMRDMARSALTKLGHPNLPLDAPVSGLSIAEQQIVEIARALIGKPRVLVLDEPTSSLTQLDAQSLFNALRQLKQDLGVSIVYISHFLEECQAICDRYTVLRDGETVGTGSMEGVALDEIIRLMVGRDLKDIYLRSRRSAGKVVLQVDGLKGKKRPSDVSFQVREGEILGVAGLVGAGRTETLRAVFGLDPMEAGNVRVRENPSQRRSPRRTLNQGVGLLSENRKEEGLLLNRSIADNLTMTRFQPVSRFGLISSSRQRAAAKQWIEKLQIKTENPFQAINELSGGNQQKVAMGRLLHHDADIFLLDEPTRGIDVGSKAQIYQIMSELANQGKAVVFVSSYLPELLGICDTIGVMCRGRMIDVRPAAQWTEHDVMAAAIGQEESGVITSGDHSAQESDRGSNDPSKSLTPPRNRFQSGNSGAKDE